MFELGILICTYFYMQSSTLLELIHDNSKKQVA